jgi:hypothetical protein
MAPKRLLLVGFAGLAVAVLLWTAWSGRWGTNLLQEVNRTPELTAGLVSAAALAWLAAAAHVNGRPRHLGLALGPLLAVVTTVALASAVEGEGSLGITATLPALGLLLGTLGLAMRHASQASPTFTTMCVLAACGCVAVAAHGSWPGGLQATYHGIPRHTGFLTHPNNLATVLAFLSVIAGMLALPAPDRPRLLRWCALLVFAVAVAAIARTFSRGGMLAAVVGCAAALAHVVRDQPATASRALRRPRMPWAAILVCAGVIVLWLGQDTTWPPLRRALSFTNPDDFSWTNRVRTLEAGWNAVLVAPWWGWGARGYGGAALAWVASPELAVLDGVTLNGWLVWAGSWGLPALAALVLLLAVAAWGAWRSPGILGSSVVGLLAVHVVTGTLEGAWLQGAGLTGWAAVGIGLVLAARPAPTQDPDAQA